MYGVRRLVYISRLLMKSAGSVCTVQLIGVRGRRRTHRGLRWHVSASRLLSTICETARCAVHRSFPGFTYRPICCQTSAMGKA